MREMKIEDLILFIIASSGCILFCRDFLDQGNSNHQYVRCKEHTQCLYVRSCHCKYRIPCVLLLCVFLSALLSQWQPPPHSRGKSFPFTSITAIFPFFTPTAEKVRFLYWYYTCIQYTVRKKSGQCRIVRSYCTVQWVSTSTSNRRVCLHYRMSFNHFIERLVM